MSAESAVYSALSGYGALTAIVGTHIYPDFLSQEIVLPGVVYQRDATDYITTVHSGAVEATRVKVDIFALALTRLTAEEVADKVQEAIAPAFLPVERRTEFDQETLRFVTVVSITLWP